MSEPAYGPTYQELQEKVEMLVKEKKRLEIESDGERGAHLSWKAAAHDQESEVARLREAIQQEAEKHRLANFCPDTAIQEACTCDLCQIAREGR